MFFSRFSFSFFFRLDFFFVLFCQDAIFMLSFKQFSVFLVFAVLFHRLVVWQYARFTAVELNENVDWALSSVCVYIGYSWESFASNLRSSKNYCSTVTHYGALHRIAQSLFVFRFCKGNCNRLNGIINQCVLRWHKFKHFIVLNTRFFRSLCIGTRQMIIETSKFSTLGYI